MTGGRAVVDHTSTHIDTRLIIDQTVSSAGGAAAAKKTHDRRTRAGKKTPRPAARRGNENNLPHGVEGLVELIFRGGGGEV